MTRVNPSEGPHNVADSDNFPIERQWADSHPEWFEPLYGQRENDPWFRLYRFRRARSVRSAHMARASARTLRPSRRAADYEFFKKNAPALARIVSRDGTYIE